MKVKLVMVGKTAKDYYQQGLDDYCQRIKHYLSFEMLIIPYLKNTRALSGAQIKQKECGLILDQVGPGDYVILLDEKGKQFSSLEFSGFVQKHMNQSTKNLVFIIGGAYGFSDELYKRANGSISLSKMTFSHLMVRTIFAEQLYRAMTIIKGEPYHHE